jgi:hypothetical protein
VDVPAVKQVLNILGGSIVVTCIIHGDTKKLVDVRVVLPWFQTAIFYLAHFTIDLHACIYGNMISSGSYQTKKELYRLDQPMLSYFT